MDQRIKAEQPKVIAGRPVNICPSLRPHAPTVLPPTTNVGARTAAVSEIELQPGKLFKNTAEDETRGGHRSVAGVTDQVL